jgi:hypothetical protein
VLVVILAQAAGLEKHWLFILPRRGTRDQTAANMSSKIPEPRMTMSYQPGLIDRTTISLFKFVNKYVAWYKLPGILGAFNLSALRVSSGDVPFMARYNLLTRIVA